MHTTRPWLTSLTSRTSRRSRLIALVALCALNAFVGCAPRTMSSLSCSADIHDDAAAATIKLTALASADPSNKEPQLCLAYAYIAQQKYPAAVEASTSALAIDKDDALALRMRAFARYRLGSYPQAIEDANASLRSETSGEAYEILGKCKMRTGDAAGAAEDFRIWANLDKSIEARCWMGSALWTTGDTAGALNTWLAAELAAPHDPEPLIWKCGFLYRAGDKSGALAAAQRAVEMAPKSPQTLGALARVQAWSGDEGGAAATVAQLNVTNPAAAAKLAKELKSSVPTATVK